MAANIRPRPTAAALRYVIAADIQRGYEAAREAQDAFEDALIAEYGKHRAIALRYAPDSSYPTHLQKLSAAFKAACEQMNAAWRRAHGED